VAVQGEQAIPQIVRAIEYFNSMAQPPEVLIITRGGGSADDLQAFSSEQVTRAVAGSRAPTLVAIGHERDESLAELAADVRASTPSNAAELLVPDRQQILIQLGDMHKTLFDYVNQLQIERHHRLAENQAQLGELIERYLSDSQRMLIQHKQLLMALSPEAPLKRGFALVRRGSKSIASASQLKVHDRLSIRFRDGEVTSIVDNTNIK
jgi:exodeoxyribonuclease VII large subunit